MPTPQPHPTTSHLVILTRPQFHENYNGVWVGRGGFQFDFTSSSLRAHFELILNSLRFHIEFTPIFL